MEAYSPAEPKVLTDLNCLSKQQGTDQSEPWVCDEVSIIPRRGRQIVHVDHRHDAGGGNFAVSGKEGHAFQAI